MLLYFSGGTGEGQYIWPGQRGQITTMILHRALSSVYCLVSIQLRPHLQLSCLSSSSPRPPSPAHLQPQGQRHLDAYTSQDRTVIVSLQPPFPLGLSGQVEDLALSLKRKVEATTAACLQLKMNRWQAGASRKDMTRLPIKKNFQLNKWNEIITHVFIYFRSFFTTWGKGVTLIYHYNHSI